MNSDNLDRRDDQLERLIAVIKNDPEFKRRIFELLLMESYQRHAVLNTWLEKLRNYHASSDLLTSLSYLFDDEIACRVLALINNRKI